MVNKRISTLDLHQTKNRTFSHILIIYVPINKIQLSKKKKPTDYETLNKLPGCGGGGWDSVFIQLVMSHNFNLVLSHLKISLEQFTCSAAATRETNTIYRKLTI